MAVDLSARTPLPRLPLLRRARLRGATALGAAAAVASRVAGRGSGASIRGKLLMQLDPHALADLLLGRTVVAVTGTNGKTTTTHMLAAAVRAQVGDGRRVVTNADGANLHHGLASALAMAPRADVAILETDERVVPDLIRLGRPAVLVMLNFSRDQMDRNHEINALGRAWRVALEQAGQDGPVVVANADDPLVTWAAGTAKRVVWVDTATTWTQDSTLCPACGAVLDRTQPVPNDPGDWSCPRCELRQPPTDWLVDGDAVVGPDGRRHELRLNVPGKFNVANGACVLAGAAELGIDPETAIAGMRVVQAPGGRFATVHFGTTTARLLLAKNPAGWAESLPLAGTSTVVLAIDSAAADGKDVSWLWDVDFEQLAGRHVIVTGPRAHDLAVRLMYAEVPHTVITDLKAALANHPEPVDVITTYTPFQRLRKLGGIA